MLEVDCTEIWKPVVGYEGLYSVSNLGRVRRDIGGRGARPGYCMKESLGSHGYPRVNLYLNKKVRMFPVHHLVLGAFVDVRPKDRECNHKDGNRRNNVLANLEWVTSAQNSRHKYDVLCYKSPRGESSGMSKLNDMQVRIIRRLRGRVSERVAAGVFGVSHNTIGSIFRRQSWKYVC